MVIEEPSIKKTILFLILLISQNISIPSDASTVTITGSLKDSTIRKPIVGGTVSIPIGKTNFQTQTDSHGSYSLSFDISQPYRSMIRFYKSGYIPAGQYIQLDPGQTYTIDYLLRDSLAPTLYHVVINNDASFTNNSQVRVLLPASDTGSGLYLMSFSGDGNTWSKPEPYTVMILNYPLINGDGLKTIYAKVRDRASNWSNPASSSITLDTISPVIAITSPQNGFVSTAETITVSGTIDDNQAAVTVNGAVAMVSNNTFTAGGIPLNVGQNTIAVTATDPAGNVSSTSLINYRLSIEEILQKVADNFALLNDMKANMTLTVTLDGQPFGDTDYCIYYFMKPNKEKTETYASADRLTKSDDTIIINGPTMYLVNPTTKAVKTIDLLSEADITLSQFIQLGISYDLSYFLSHAIRRNDAASDFNAGLIAVDAIPNAPNNLYDKLQMQIDYKKGLLVKSSLYKNGSLMQAIETIESQQMPNGAWVPKVMVKKPVLSSGQLITTMTYSNISVNVGLTDLDFDPNR